MYDKVWYVDAKTLWIRPEIENQRKRYPIDPQIYMWCCKDPSNQSIKLDLILSW
jgi:hypothetical protein